MTLDYKESTLIQYLENPENFTSLFLVGMFYICFV